MTRPLPPGLPVALDDNVSLWAGGRVATGGSPWRLARFKDAALPHLSALRRAGRRGLAPGSPLGRALARQLLDRGLAHPVPAPRPGPHPVTVVVPAYRRADELGRCLTALAGLPVIVVDDGSPNPTALRDVADAHGAVLVRHSANRGPAAARNTGLALARSPFVAFVDSDCRPEAGWLDTLIPYFDDPRVAAVAPRVVPDCADNLTQAGTKADSNACATGALARYERARSSLDMGTAPALVRPGGKVGFVPTATLIVRRDAVDDRAFDEDMRLGEDVDFVWRLDDSGHHVRYQPQARVAHTPRLAWTAWARRRHEYGTSAAALAARHPGRLAPVRASGWNLVTLALLTRRKFVPAAGSAVFAAALLRRGLAGTPSATALSATVVAKGLSADAIAVGHALRREWWPVGLLCLAASGRSATARAAAATMLGPVVADWLTRRPAPGLDVVRWSVLRLADDLCYGTGVTASAWRNRSLAPLLPDVSFPLPQRRPAT
ncbi:mycofactocin biosynthesis glycosyltransferase MftF [Yinghuangia sp. YIM S10712]|uniref:mycofactocin biosynthesis glycosyltransferase MftF n=1 Tax=Yinghuangia sp. YIM S10712 TaxID=3436930 RepID=UPI003F53ACA1